MSDYSEQEYDEDQEGVEEPELGDEEGGEDEAAEQEEEEVCVTFEVVCFAILPMVCTHSHCHDCH